MNISLEEYRNFANKINFDSALINHVFCYKHNKSQLVLNPFQLGELYREYERYRLNSERELLSKLNETMKIASKKKDLTLSDIMKEVNDFIKYENTGLQTKLNRLK